MKFIWEINIGVILHAIVVVTTILLCARYVAASIHNRLDASDFDEEENSDKK